MTLVRRILSGFILATALFFLPIFTDASVVDRVTAIVNDDIILESELEGAISLYRESETFVSIYNITDVAFSEQIRSKVLSSLIDEKLIEQEISRLGISVTLEEVDAAIEHIMELNNCHDLDVFLKRDGISIEEFRTEVRKQISKTRLIDRYIYSRIAITEEKIQCYYDNNFNLYDGVLNLHLCSVLINLPFDAKHEERSSLFADMIDILNQLDSGIDFDQVVIKRSYSENGIIEYLGVFARDQLSDDVWSLIEELAIGKSTHIINTAFGLQSFYIKDITKTEIKPLEMVKDEIYQKLLLEESSYEFKAWLDSVKNRSNIKLVNSAL